MAKRRKKDMNFHNPLRICSEFLLLIYTSKNLSLQFIYPLFHFCNYISFNIFFTDTVLRERLPTLEQYDKVECTLFASVAPEKCLSGVNCWCSNILDDWSFNARCNRAFENRQTLAKIVHFQSNTQAKARSCRIFNARACSSSNFHFRTCSSLLNARFFHTRCNTTGSFVFPIAYLSVRSSSTIEGLLQYSPPQHLQYLLMSL